MGASLDQGFVHLRVRSAYSLLEGAIKTGAIGKLAQAGGMPAAALEHVETYLRTVFGFIGVTNLEFIVAEGLAVGPDHREKGIASAIAAASTVVANA